MGAPAGAASGGGAPAAVLCETAGGVGFATLNRPEKFNCLSGELLAGLTAAVAAFEADPAIRVMVIRAAGRHFCTGADLDEVLAARREETALRRFIEAGHAALRRLETSPLPVIAQLHGLALAGGLELLLCCDLVIAGAGARLGDQHAQFGLVPGWGGTQRLPRLVGLRRALELMLSGRWLSAAEARDWGLVNEVVAEAALAGRVASFAAELAARNPDSIAEMKRLSRAGLEMDLEAGLAMEVGAVVPALRTANVDEGLAAFKARRPPVFR